MPRNKHKRNWERVAVVYWFFHWVVAPKGAICVFECLSLNLALQDSFKQLIFTLLKQLMWEDDSNSDPFAGIDEDEDVDLLYANSFKQQQAKIDPKGYENLFGDSDREDFYGF